MTRYLGKHRTGQPLKPSLNVRFVGVDDGASATFRRLAAIEHQHQMVTRMEATIDRLAAARRQRLADEPTPIFDALCPTLT